VLSFLVRLATQSMPHHVAQGEVWPIAKPCGTLTAMDVGQQVLPHALCHDVDMDDERRKKLRRLGRIYRAAMEAEKKAREELAAEALTAVDKDKEPVGEVAREIGFDREWIRRARLAEQNRIKQETGKKAAAGES
jgi:hypothetical protein